MLERVVELSPAVPAEETVAPPELGIAALEKRIAAALEAASGNRRGLAGQINRALLRLPSAISPRAAADFLLQQLEGGRLQELVDVEGRSARSVAVEALLTLGFPYALEVAPEDLESLRDDGRRPIASRAAMASLALAAGGAVSELARLAGHAELMQVGGVSRATFSLAAVAWIASRRPKSALRRWGVLGLGLLGILLTVTAGGAPLLGACVLAAGFILVPHE